MAALILCVARMVHQAFIVRISARFRYFGAAGLIICARENSRRIDVVYDFDA